MTWNAALYKAVRKHICFILPDYKRPSYTLREIHRIQKSKKGEKSHVILPPWR